MAALADVEKNLVSWALSGTYDENKAILIDAEDPSRTLSRKKVCSLIARLAGSFTAGTTVCVHLPNDILYPVIVLAILASACCWTGSNPAYTPAELTHHVKTSKTSYIITSPQHLANVEAALKEVSYNIRIILFDDLLSEAANVPADIRTCGDGKSDRLHQRYNSLGDVLKRNGSLPLRERLSRITQESAAAVMSTSGTTGLPKMLQRSHSAIVTETKAARDPDYFKPYAVRRLYCTPIFHAFSFPEMVVNSLRLGYPSFYMRRFDDTFSAKVSRFAITETMAAPPMLARLAEQAKTHPALANQLQTLRSIRCAGAALSSELRSRFLAIFRKSSDVRVVQVWGMSEGGWFATFKYPENDTTGSVGRPIAGNEVRCAQDSTEPRSLSSSIGSELLVRAPHMTRGYIDNPNATAETFDQAGWLRTGDIGYVRDGKVYLIDRAKDMIKVNGWSVSPAELEAALLRHKGIEDVAVVGIGTGIEERPAAFVVPTKHTRVSVEELTEHMLQYVTRYKGARCEIRFVDSIPRNPSGKILRMILRQLFLEGTLSDPPPSKPQSKVVADSRPMFSRPLTADPVSQRAQTEQ